MNILHRTPAMLLAVLLWALTPATAGESGENPGFSLSPLPFHILIDGQVPGRIPGASQAGIIPNPIAPSARVEFPQESEHIRLQIYAARTKPGGIEAHGHPTVVFLHEARSFRLDRVMAPQTFRPGVYLMDALVGYRSGCVVFSVQ